MLVNLLPLAFDCPVLRRINLRSQFAPDLASWTSR
jgi:hypothetical protein